MKTAINELIDLILKGKLNSMLDILAGAYLLRQKEKQQIIEAYEKSIDNGINDGGEDSENYYNETFK